MQMEPDGNGGVWIAQNHAFDLETFVQHVDVSGWPLLWERRVGCSAGFDVSLRSSDSADPVDFGWMAWPRGPRGLPDGGVSPDADVGLDAGSDVEI
jgi:hypothetical protein